MNIALLAPTYYPIEKRSDGGIETFLYGLADGLVARGHNVDLYGVKGSKTAATTIAVVDEGTGSLTSDPYVRQSREIASSVKAFRLVQKKAADYTVIHNNQIVFYSHLQVAKLPNALTTLHSPPDYYPVLQAQDIDSSALKERIVAISDFQRESGKHIKFTDRVYNGLNEHWYEFNAQGGDHLAWIGRIIPEKGITEAIEVAKSTNMELKFAGSPWIESFQKQILDSVVGHPITFLGHTDLAAKNELLGKARAFIFPTHYNEFGYVRIEALACGTPVITYDRGAAREIVLDGVTGFLCPPGDVEALKEAVKKIVRMPENEYREMRLACRRHVEKNFTLTRMVDSYEQLYQKLSADTR